MYLSAVGTGGEAEAELVRAMSWWSLARSWDEVAALMGGGGKALEEEK